MNQIFIVQTLGSKPNHYLATEGEISTIMVTYQLKDLKVLTTQGRKRQKSKILILQLAQKITGSGSLMQSMVL
jgi:hypothetical protein